MIDETHDPALTSWVESANQPDADFPIQNLPFGMFQAEGHSQPGVAIGEFILPIDECSDLNELMSWPAPQRREMRRRLSRYLSGEPKRRELVPMSLATMMLPAAIGDYSDFYASLDHATNVGTMLRPSNPLLPNYRHLPIAYHGRSSSIVVSGTAVTRPSGQITDRPEGPPRFAPARSLDYELELGLFVGPGNPMGQPIPIDRAEDHLFGVCLLNDWSARDIQSWEYQPLGPFLGKNFATSISPWIVTVDALEPFREPGPLREGLLEYLQAGVSSTFGIRLEVWLRTASMTKAERISGSEFGSLFWTPAQMITHHTSNGCPFRAGDLLGSGTVSGPERENRGCLLELTWRGSEPLTLSNGETRRWLEDGDEVILRGFCERTGYRRIGLGECRGVIRPAV